MMKKQTIRRLTVRMLAVSILLLCLSANAMAYDAVTAAGWMEQFAQALTALAPVNDPVQTADPARAGEYLLEYEFGTVLSTVSAQPHADSILEIDVRTHQVTDCRGVRVGMELSSALDGAVPQDTASPLYVLSAQEDGWSWAYMGKDGIYGVEYIAYGDRGAGVKEYTLTYVVEDGLIASIRMKVADATLAQAQDGLKTAQEIAARQQAMILANDRPALAWEDFRIMGVKALGVPVAQLIAGIGEPLSIQTLPQSAGRVLVYDGAVVTLGFNETTGEEIVKAVSVSTSAFEGPNRLKVGMTIGEAGALVRCDTNVYSRGGLLYLEGEATGEPPYGELRVDGDEMTLMYACAVPGDTALLQAIVSDGSIASWQMMYLSDMQEGI